MDRTEWLNVLGDCAFVAGCFLLLCAIICKLQDIYLTRKKNFPLK